MKLRHLDLFSGIGGFSLGLEATGGFETIAFCECENYCVKVLQKHWPEVPVFGDIKKLKRTDINETIDIITGGFPCQPFSVAGKRAGKEDDRYLWPEMRRIIEEFRPVWVIGENVAGFIRMELARTISDLENLGYEVWPVVIPACAVGAPHRRDRVWIIAHAGRELLSRNEDRKKSETQNGASGAYESERQFTGDRIGTAADAVVRLACNKVEASARAWGKNWMEVAQQFCGMDDGISYRVDRHRGKRLKCLGNAVVPQIPYEIGRMILEIENERSRLAEKIK